MTSLRFQAGSGNAIGFGIGPLQISSSWNGLGLRHLDELVCNNLLASWSGSTFCPLSVRLPSSSAAVLEVWPHTVEESLTSWLGTVVLLTFSLCSKMQLVGAF